MGTNGDIKAHPGPRAGGYQVTNYQGAPQHSRQGQGGPPQFFPGALVGPPPPFAISAIECHQKSTPNSAGSSVGSLVLSTPPGHPATGRCVRVRAVPVPPLLLCTRVVDWGSKPHSRSAPAPVGSSPGLVLSSAVTGDFRAVGISRQLTPNSSRDFGTASQPAQSR
jgi:hypothetical protein